jgi:hypothetical protein
MSNHRFLTSDRKVQRTVFGEGPDAVEVIVNASATNFLWSSELGGQAQLPPCGFLVESPTFVAFHARAWNGLNYEAPPMFVLRSLDGQPLSRSRKLRVFHAFGDARIHVGKATQTVAKEAILDATTSGTSPKN